MQRHRAQADPSWAAHRAVCFGFPSDGEQPPTSKETPRSWADSLGKRGKADISSPDSHHVSPTSSELFIGKERTRGRPHLISQHPLDWFNGKVLMVRKCFRPWAGAHRLSTFCVCVHRQGAHYCLFSTPSILPCPSYLHVRAATGEPVHLQQYGHRPGAPGTKPQKGERHDKKHLKHCKVWFSCLISACGDSAKCLLFLCS